MGGRDDRPTPQVPRPAPRMGQRFCEEPVIHIDFDMRVFDGAAPDHACLECPMPKNAKFKTLVRSRMERTGETYTQARDALLLEKTAQPAPEAAATAPTTLDRIREVMEQYPDLAYAGFKDEKAFKLGPTTFEESRARLLTDYAVGEVENCLACLEHVRRGRRGQSSYSMKHVVESWQREKGIRKPQSYVANGSLIVAARIAGFRIKHEADHINCLVYANEDDLHDLSQGRPPNRVKPSPFVAWLFKQRHRDDAVGDLASDVRRDRSFSPASGEHDLALHLRFKGSHVQKALRTAHKEWQKTLDGK
jgi:hypothetical protein